MTVIVTKTGCNERDVMTLIKTELLASIEIRA